MNLQQQVNFLRDIEAAANPFPLKASFHKSADGLECKLCGDKMSTQGAAVDHLLKKHRQMASCSTGKMKADGMNSPKMEARDFSEKKRKKLAKTGAAMPGGGFPIVNTSDLANAKRAIGRAKNPAAARRHINERAKALGAKPIGAEGMAAGGPGSGRHKESGSSNLDKLANQHKPHAGMCNLGNPVCKAYIDKRIEDPNWTPSGPRKALKAVSLRENRFRHSGALKPHGMKPACPTAKAPRSKMTAEQFSPADRLRMPPKAGTSQRTVAPPGINIQASSMIKLRPGRPRRKIGNVMRGSQIG